MALTPDFSITAGDTTPSITAQLQDATGAAVNLTGSAVVFRMRHWWFSGSVIEGEADTGPSPGEVAYDWAALDTAVPGYYRARWLVTFPSGVVASFPNDRDLVVLVQEGA